jgi:hypothetical protein
MPILTGQAVKWPRDRILIGLELISKNRSLDNNIRLNLL